MTTTQEADRLAEEAKEYALAIFGDGDEAFEGVKFAGKTVDEAIDAQITAAMAATPKEPR